MTNPSPQQKSIVLKYRNDNNCTLGYDHTQELSKAIYSAVYVMTLKGKLYFFFKSSSALHFFFFLQENILNLFSGFFCTREEAEKISCASLSDKLDSSCLCGGTILVNVFEKGNLELGYPSSPWAERMETRYFKL